MKTVYRIIINSYKDIFQTVNEYMNIKIHAIKIQSDCQFSLHFRALNLNDTESLSKFKCAKSSASSNGMNKVIKIMSENFPGSHILKLIRFYKEI